ncbi:hypothetical protein CBR_g39084 [Chara braunii]|uniref:Uncharacterized protein n=1 Tax=Chara braunii TaxID=69332 RepID=A0A388LQU2_CHABU|nr:hypothetical protein CBR_g39084 [Chara braunii]|eukprot:GBG84708.1 hypothetical protein CBR_g39084 [Chara braunii]
MGGVGGTAYLSAAFLAGSVRAPFPLVQFAGLAAVRPGPPGRTCPSLGEDIHHHGSSTPHRSGRGAEAVVLEEHFGDRPVAANRCAAVLVVVAALVAAGSIAAAAIASAFAGEAAVVGSASAGTAADDIAPFEFATRCGVAPHIGYFVAARAPGSVSVRESTTAVGLVVGAGDIGAAFVGAVVVGIAVAAAVADVVAALGGRQFDAERAQAVAAAEAAVDEGVVAYPDVHPGAYDALDTHPCAAVCQPSPLAAVDPQWRTAVGDS